MNDTLIARIDPQDCTRLHWRDDDGRAHSDSLAAFAAALAGRECVLLVDAARVTLLTLELPVADLRTARQAAPFAAEERLAQPLDELHFALAARGEGRYALAALERAWREALGEALRDASLEPRLVLPEACGLPRTQDGWTIALEGDTALLRTAAGEAFKTDLAGLAGLLPLLRQQLPGTARVVVLANGEPEAWPRAALQGLEVVWRAPLSPAEQLATLADEADLRLFETASMNAQRARAARLWRAAAAVAALTVLAWPALLAWQHSVLEREERAQSTANEALFRATFPDVTRLVNPRVQADQALAALRGGSTATPRLLDLLARIEAVRQTEFPEDTRVTLASFAGGLLELGVEVAGMDAVEALRGALVAAGLGAETVSAEAADGKVVARLRVQVGS